MDMKTYKLSTNVTKEHEKLDVIVWGECFSKIKSFHVFFVPFRGYQYLCR